MPKLKCRVLSNVLCFDIKCMHFDLHLDQQAGNDRGVGRYPAGQNGTGQAQEPTNIIGMSKQKLR